MLITTQVQLFSYVTKYKHSSLASKSGLNNLVTFWALFRDKIFSCPSFRAHKKLQVSGVYFARIKWQKTLMTFPLLCCKLQSLSRLLLSGWRQEYCYECRYILKLLNPSPLPFIFYGWKIRTTHSLGLWRHSWYPIKCLLGDSFWRLLVESLLALKSFLNSLELFWFLIFLYRRITLFAGLGIRSFDYSRTRKQEKTANREQEKDSFSLS